MKIICTQCGLVHNSRATEHLKDRLCCYDTVRLVNNEVEERIKAEYAKLFPLSCNCGSMVTSQEPGKLCCRFTLIYVTDGIKGVVEYEVEKDNHRKAKERGVKPIFKRHTCIKDMEVICRMINGEAVKMEKEKDYGRNQYTIHLDCAKVVFLKSTWGKGFHAFLYINGWEDSHLERRTIKEHAQQIGMKLACMFTN